MKIRHPFANKNWYAHKKTYGHTYNKQAVEQQKWCIKEGQESPPKRPKVQSSLLVFTMVIK